MEQIRYKQRIWQDDTEIQAFLEKMRTGVIAMQGAEYPYALPVNYVWVNGKVFFHGMGSGKKDSILSNGAKVCFTVYHEYGTVMDPMPCHADTSYQSVIIFGNAKKLTDSEEAAVVLQALVEKYMPEFYKQKLTGGLLNHYRSSMDGNAVSVYEIDPEQLTAKENIAKPEDLFSGKE